MKASIHAFDDRAPAPRVERKGFRRSFLQRRVLNEHLRVWVVVRIERESKQRQRGLILTGYQRSLVN